VGLTADQWLMCLIPGVVIFFAGEIFKKIMRENLGYVDEIP